MNNAYQNFRKTVDDIAMTHNYGNINITRSQLLYAIYAGTIFILNQHNGDIQGQGIMNFLYNEIPNDYFKLLSSNEIQNKIKEGYQFYLNNKNNNFNSVNNYNNFNNNYNNNDFTVYNSKYDNFGANMHNVFLKGAINDIKEKEENNKNDFNLLFQENNLKQNSSAPVKETKQEVNNIGIINNEYYLLDNGIYVKNNELCGKIMHEDIIFTNEYKKEEMDFESIKEDIILNYTDFQLGKTLLTKIETKYYSNMKDEHIYNIETIHLLADFIPLMAKYCKIVTFNIMKDYSTLQKAINDIESIKTRDHILEVFNKIKENMSNLNLEIKEGKMNNCIKLTENIPITFLFNKNLFQILNNIDGNSYYIIDQIGFKRLHNFLNQLYSNEVFIFDGEKYINFTFSKDIKEPDKFILFLISKGELNGK